MDKNISVYIPGEGGGGVRGRGCGELQGVKSGHVLGRISLHLLCSQLVTAREGAKHLNIKTI